MAIGEAGWSAFFESIRPAWGTIDAEAIEPTKQLVQTAYDMGLLRNQTAYCVGTALWETGFKMMPVTENLYYTTAARIRQVWPSRFPSIAIAAQYTKNPRRLANKVYNGRMGNREGTDDGYNYRGRGFVQITGRDAYARASREIDADFVADPDLALRVDYAVEILLVGMRDGWFRPPHKLDKYMTLQVSDYVGARNIINADVTANGAKIAKLAKAADQALRAMEAAEPEAPVPDGIEERVAALEARLGERGVQIEKLMREMDRVWPRGMDRNDE